jgi:predicted DNA-binding transcriptional regulator AlpA
MQPKDHRTVLELPSQGAGAVNRDGSRRRGVRWLKAGLTPSARPVPSVASLVANPSSAADVPVDRIPALVAELASEQSALSALQGVLTTRLLVSQANAVGQPDSVDRLLTVDEVARVLGVTRRWVQRRARRLPFARRISEHAIRYSESGLKRWMSNRKISAA